MYAIGVPTTAYACVVAFSCLSFLADRREGSSTVFTLSWRREEAASGGDGDDDDPPDGDPNDGEAIPEPPKLKLVGVSKAA
jgi:hypothetical protein